MPKDNIVNKVDGRIVRQKPARKFKVGTRKSGKSAHGMTNADLMAALERKDNAKSRNKIRSVLAARGVTAIVVK